MSFDELVNFQNTSRKASMANVTDKGTEMSNVVISWENCRDYSILGGTNISRRAA